MAQEQSGTQAPARAVLEGIERVGYHIDDRYYFTPLVACLRSCAAYLGVDVFYAQLMGISGAAFRLVWNTSKWDGGNVDVVFMSPDPVDVFCRAFEGIGYAFAYHARDQGSERAFRAKVIESIYDAGRPLIALGVIGPPEACIVAGYDEGGSVLVGWNFFQDRPSAFPEQDFELSGYYRARDWFSRTTGLIEIGDPQERPDLETLYRRSLEWALRVVRTPLIHAQGGTTFFGGLRAYEAWAEWMQRDADFPDDLAVLAERKMVHYDAMCMVSERGHAATYLREVAQRLPAAAEALHAAAACYERETAFLGAMHEATDGFIGSEERLRALLDPAARRAIAQAALRARDADAEAAEYLEQALSA